MIKHAECGGANFRYAYRKLHNKGPTIVYVGGAFQSVESVMKCEEWLQHFSHLIVELPGFGESLQVKQQTSFDLFAACIHTAISECNLSNIYAYAYSYGVGPMGRYVSQHEDQVNGLVVGGASASMTPEMEERVERLIGSTRCKKEFTDVFASTFFYQPEEELFSGRLSHSLVKRKLRSVTDIELEKFVENYRTLLREHRKVAKVSKVPVMAIGGELDTFVDPELLNGFKNYCDEIETFKIPRADHFYYLQRPDLLLHMVGRFVERCEIPALPVAHIGYVDEAISYYPVAAGI